MIVCIDPGHGGADPGALGRGGIREADIVLDISKHLGRYLKQAGMDVIFTRTTDVDLAPGNDDKEELQARCSVANKSGASLFISIHADAFSQPSVRGTRCYHYPTSTRGRAAAQAVADHIRPMAQIAGASRNMATISSANYYVLKNTVMPAVLIETGFMTNETDLALLCESGYRDKLGLVIALAIINYFRS
jgi:N-acetylmuramoyl-L-alanine amidase